MGGGSKPEHDKINVRDVWAHNLAQEFHLINTIVEQGRYCYCSIDTEFPGVVMVAANGHKGRGWSEMRANVDALRLIQVGIAFSDENGRPPPGLDCWQFNFEFDVNADLHAKDSIALLREAGCDFVRHRSCGLCPFAFGELLIASGLIGSERIKWISFHGGYDFAYLVKSLTASELPQEMPAMLQMMDIFFPQRCDVKYLARESYRGGLQGLAQKLGCAVDRCHQAGFDAVMTRDVFFSLPDFAVKAFANPFAPNQGSAGLIFGLGGDFYGPSDAAVNARFPERMLREARRQWRESRPDRDWGRSWQYSDTSYFLGWDSGRRSGWDSEWFPLDQWSAMSQGQGMVY